jgi:hypothetical protein
MQMITMRGQPRVSGRGWMTRMLRRSSVVAVAAVCLMSGCVSGSEISHADDPAAVNPDQGPDLCRDGTAPPCTPRS